MLLIILRRFCYALFGKRGWVNGFGDCCVRYLRMLDSFYRRHGKALHHLIGVMMKVISRGDGARVYFRPIAEILPEAAVA